MPNRERRPLAYLERQELMIGRRLNWYREVRRYWKHPIFKLLAKVLLSGLLLYLIFKRVSWTDLKESLLAADLWLVAAALAILLGRVPMMAWRWKTLLEIRDSRTPFNPLISYYFIGGFFNNFLPTLVGGDIARAVYLTRHTVSNGVAISSVVVERLLGVVALCFLGGLSFLFTPQILDSTGLSLIIILMMAFALTLIAALLWQYVTHRVVIPKPKSGLLSRLWSSVTEMTLYAHRPAKMAWALTLSIIAQLAGIWAAYLVSVGVDAMTPMIHFMVLLPVIWLISMLPISLNGLGLREGAFVYLFGLFGMPRQTALVISVLWLALTYGLSVIGGIMFLLHRKPNEIE